MPPTTEGGKASTATVSHREKRKSTTFLLVGSAGSFGRPVPGPLGHLPIATLLSGYLELREPGLQSLDAPGGDIRLVGSLPERIREADKDSVIVSTVSLTHVPSTMREDRRPAVFPWEFELLIERAPSD